MRTAALLSCLALALCGAAPCQAVLGVTDRVPGSSLLVPFFEVGVDVSSYPHDTLLVVTNIYPAPVTIHYQYWTIDGGRPSVHGNVTLAAKGTWSASSRDVLAGASAYARGLLVDPDHPQFYRGFVTIDAVKNSTDYHPTGSFYPFEKWDWLIGFTYYTRLSQGSANGLAMVPLETVIVTDLSTVKAPLRGFYRASDNDREQMTADSRACATQMVYSGKCYGDFLNHAIDVIALRLFGSRALGGHSRAVVFAWSPGRTGGPTRLCASPAAGCATSYQARVYDESGAEVNKSTIELPHVVNVMEYDLASSGWLEIYNVPSFNQHTQVYAFSFNSGSPMGNVTLTWDAIFEGFIWW